MHEYLKMWLERDALPCDHYELLGKPRFFHDRDALLQAGREGFASLQGYHNADSVRRVRARDLQRQCAAAVQIFESDAAWQKYDEQLRLRRPESSHVSTQPTALSVVIDTGQAPARATAAPDQGPTTTVLPPDLAATVAITISESPTDVVAANSAKDSIAARRPSPPTASEAPGRSSVELNSSPVVSKSAAMRIQSMADEAKSVPVGGKSSQSGAYRVRPPSPPPPPPRDRRPKSTSSRSGASNALPTVPLPAVLSPEPVVGQSDRITAIGGLDSRGVRLMLIVAAATAVILLAIAGVVTIVLNVFSQSQAPKTAWNLVQPVRSPHRPIQPVVNGQHLQES